MPMSWIVPPFV